MRKARSSSTSCMLLAASLLAPSGGADPPAAYLELGTATGEPEDPIVWHEVPPAAISRAVIGIDAPVGAWATLLMEAHLVRPPEGELLVLYEELIGDFPFLEESPSQIVVREGLTGNAVLHVAQGIFDVAFAKPTAQGTDVQVRRWYQPIIDVDGDLDEFARRIWYTDATTWIIESANGILGVWRPLVADCAEDESGSGSESFDLDLASVWEAGVDLKDDAGAAFLAEPGRMREAIRVGLGLKLQALVVTSSLNEPSDFTLPEDQLDTGLDGIASGKAEIDFGLSEPIVIHVTVGPGFTDVYPWIKEPGPFEVSANASHSFMTHLTPTLESSITVMMSGSGQSFTWPLVYDGPGRARVDVPIDAPSGLGHVVAIANPFALLGVVIGEMPIVIHPEE